jgi:hypothetical protein
LFAAVQAVYFWYRMLRRADMKLGGMDKLKYYVCQADRLIAPGIDNLLKNGSIHECLQWS